MVNLENSVPGTETDIVNLARTFQQLKRIPRTGWLLRGVPPGEAENVAAHTAGTSLLALALAELVSVPVDRARLLAICLLHDLAEARLSDLPWPAARYLPAGAKRNAEEQVLDDVLAGLPFAAPWQELWQEFEDASTTEGRLARDADRLDMLFQAAAYEQAGRRGLDEFWKAPDGLSWYFPESAGLSAQLQVQRPNLAAGIARTEER